MAKEINQKALNSGGVFVILIAAGVTFFACMLSSEPYLSFGIELMSNVQNRMGLGWLDSRIAQYFPQGRVLGWIATSFFLMQLWKKKPGLFSFESFGVLVGLALCGGVGTFLQNLGAIAGALLFLWANAVQLSAWAGRVAGFSPKWAKDLAPYITTAYISEVVMNLALYTPYGSGLQMFIDDARYQALDTSLINYGGIAVMIASIVAVEATAVFFIKFSESVRHQLDKSSGKAKTAAASYADSTATYAEPSSADWY